MRNILNYPRVKLQIHKLPINQYIQYYSISFIIASHYIPCLYIPSCIGHMSSAVYSHLSNLYRYHSHPPITVKVKVRYIKSKVIYSSCKYLENATEYFKKYYEEIYSLLQYTCALFYSTLLYSTLPVRLEMTNYPHTEFCAQTPADSISNISSWCRFW